MILSVVVLSLPNSLSVFLKVCFKLNLADSNFAFAASAFHFDTDLAPVFVPGLINLPPPGFCTVDNDGKISFADALVIFTELMNDKERAKDYVAEYYTKFMEQNFNNNISKEVIQSQNKKENGY